MIAHRAGVRHSATLGQIAVAALTLVKTMGREENVQRIAEGALVTVAARLFPAPILVYPVGGAVVLNGLVTVDHRPARYIAEQSRPKGPVVTPYLYLFLAVVAETIGTSALQASQQFTRLGPSILVVVGYAVAFWFLALTLRFLPVGVAYATWSGLGIVLIALIGWIVFGQRMDAPALIGMGLILSGIVVVQLFSSTASH